jgi:hypothetical protein
MAFKLKTGKTINKVLAGAGIVALGTLVLNQVAPGIAQSTIGKVVLPAVSYGVAGLEGAAGAVVTEVAGHSLRSFTGANALDNVQTESL